MSAVNLVGSNIHINDHDELHRSEAVAPIKDVASSVLTNNYFARAIVSAFTGMRNLFPASLSRTDSELDFIRSDEEGGVSILEDGSIDSSTYECSDSSSNHSEFSLDNDHYAGEFMDGDLLDDYDLFRARQGVSYKNSFSAFVKRYPGQLTVEKIDSALSDPNALKRKEAFSALAKHAVGRLTNDHINLALSDEDGGVRKNAVSVLAEYAPDRLTNDHINLALSDEDAGVQRQVFSMLFDRVPDRVTDEHINRALTDANPDVRKDALDTLINYAPHRLTNELINRALSDPDPAVRKDAVYDLAKGAPDRLTDVHVDRALSDADEQVRDRALYAFYRHRLLKAYFIERLVFPAGEFNSEVYKKLPFVEEIYLQVGFLNELPPEELKKLDGRLFSALPDGVLESLNANVLNSLTATNKEKLGMRVFAKLSDEAFMALDSSVLGHKGIVSALSTNPQAFFDMPEWRQGKIAENIVK